MTNEQVELIEQLLSQKLEPLLEHTRQQSAQIELLKEQLEQQTDSLEHLNAQLQGKQRPPAPISKAWKPLGFPSEGALRGAIRRGVYTQERGEILRRNTSILVNVQRCLESGFTPTHRRQRSA